MANYIENFNSKLDWAMPFQRTGKFPLDRSTIFDSYNDALLYAQGGPDNRGLSGTSYVGQIIVVYENDDVIPYVISESNSIRKLKRLAASQSVDNHTNDFNNPHNVTKEQLGLENVTNDAQVKRSEMGVANGVAVLDENGIISIAQLPTELNELINGELISWIILE